MNPYGRNSKLAAYQTVSVHGAVADADPHAMVQMLLDGAAQRLAIVRGCMERHESARQASLLHSCVTILAELRGCLNMTGGGSLAQNLSDLYEYMVRRLLLANSTSDVGCVIEVSRLLEDIRAAWVAIGPEVRRPAAAGMAPAWGPIAAPGGAPTARSAAGYAAR